MYHAVQVGGLRRLKSLVHYADDSAFIAKRNREAAGKEKRRPKTTPNEAFAMLFANS